MSLKNIFVFMQDNEVKTMDNVLSTANERDLKEAIIDLVTDNEYLQQENRRLEDKLALRPVNIFVDKNDCLLFIETEHHKKMSLESYNNIYSYFQEKGLTHIFYCDGIPVIQINLPKRKIYKLMGQGVI